MKIRATHTFFFLFFFLSSLAGRCAFAEQLVVPGTGACEVILRELAAVFNAENPGSEVIIPPSIGSSRGISLVGKGEYVMARVARSLEKTEIGYGLIYQKFAKDLIVFAAGPKAGIDNLSSGQLADIYSGKVLTWKDVGGNDTPVRLLIRNPEDTIHKIITQQIDTFRDIDFSDHAKVMYHDYEMVNALNKYSTAIGMSTSSTLKIVDPAVKPIALNNIEPTQQNIFDNNYTLAVEYGLVYKEGKLEGLAKKFVEFITSKKASRILKDAGLVPVNTQQ